jgi:hypothetical protein
MRSGMLCALALTVGVSCLGLAGPTMALISQPASLSSAIGAEQGDELVPVRGRAGGGGRGAGRGGAAFGPRGGVAVRSGGAVGPRGGAVRRTTAAVGPRGNVGVRRTTAAVGPRGNVAVRRTTAVAARPYRAWVRRPYYGRVIAGVTLGTIIAVSAIPAAPSSEVCWYWANSSKTRGYWDYCT